MSNRELRMTLETVTPLFLAGAEPRGAPELRAPAFRGALRYWLRAALGGVIGDNNLEDLHRLEAAVFGSTEVVSRIVLRVIGKELVTKSTSILPHKSGKGVRPAYVAGQRFDLFLTGRYPVQFPIWKAAVASLNLASTFGGIGLRSRRGFGTLRVVEASGHYPITTPTSYSGWRSHVQRVTSDAIEAASQLARSLSVRTVDLPKGPAAFPCATRTGIIRLTEPAYPSAIDAVTAFMRKVPDRPYLGGIKPRQSSPLWVRPVQMGDQYGFLFLVLASRLKTGTDYTALREFLETFPGENITVEGWNA